MFNSRRFLSYANVTATLALVLSMSGGALAADHYLINSTSQINPKVIKALKSDAGAKGAPGAPGAAGKEGATGKEGAAGKEGTPGTPGKDGTAGNEGAPGTALAYAHVTAEGDIEPGSKGMSTAKVELVKEGIYCISGISAGSLHNVQVTADDGEEGEEIPLWATSAKASLGIGDESTCPKGTEVTVETLDEGFEEDAGFYIELN